MSLFNINRLSSHKMEKFLGRFDGITDAIAKKVALYALGKEKAGRTAFENKTEFMAILKKSGLNARYSSEIDKVIDVYKETLLPYDLYNTKFEINPDLFFDYSEDFVVPDEEGPSPFPNEDDASLVFDEEETPQDKRPLVFVPGIQGSELYITTKSGFEKKMWPPLGLNGIDIFKNLEDPIRKGELHTGTLTSLDAYSVLITNLAKIGYNINENLFVNTYNWTQSNEISGVELAANIKIYLKKFNEKYKTKYKEVDVICHSMGGLVTKSAIKNNKAPVRKTVYIATPHFGSPKAYFTLNNNINITGFWTEVLFDIFKIYTGRNSQEYNDLNEALNSLAALCDSSYELLPNSFYLDNVNMLRYEEALPPFSETYVKGKEETYFKNKWQLLHADHIRAQRGTDFVEKLGKTPPGEHLLIACPDLPTLDEVEFNFDVIGKDEFEAPEASPRGGDETVPIYSSVSGGSKNVVYVKKSNHGTIPNTEEAFISLVKYLGLMGKK